MEAANKINLKVIIVLPNKIIKLMQPIIKPFQITKLRRIIRHVQIIKILQTQIKQIKLILKLIQVLILQIKYWNKSNNIKMQSNYNLRIIFENNLSN